MAWLMIKYFITATVDVFISGLVKRSDKLSALYAQLPLIFQQSLVAIITAQRSLVN